MAEEEIRLAMGEHHDDPWLHTFLGVSLIGQNRSKEALESVGTAISLAPDLAFPHNLLSQIHLQLGEVKEAKAAILEAIRIDPMVASFHVHLAYIFFSQGEWESALVAAEQGLSLDPEEVDGLNIRGRILVKLGRTPEASEAFQTSMNRDPDNTYTHINRGWALLEEGDYDRALDHFREGVRLDPNNTDAKAGLVEGLKAKYWIYRAYLKFAFSLEKLSSKARWGLMIGLIVIVKIVPFLAPFYLAFIFFSWFSDLLFSTLLRFNVYGRYALNKKQVNYSNIFSALLVSGTSSLIGGLAGGMDLLSSLGIVLLALLFPVAGTYNRNTEKSRKRSMIYTFILAGVGSLFLITEAMNMEVAGTLFLGFMLGAVGYTWWVQTQD